ncbi:YhjD/YihY/BrkB family envelope integrity protein [Kocuria palustris]|uniref:YhjD/YihY/BrkB family envelope integrity protein n=1 Tax=Kocuria palustris TaxID=71999 RepID=UPI0011A3AE1A|nr:YhjD/YihY/BrkB family envelope integrity protein [Kocuria palustris]
MSTRLDHERPGSHRTQAGAASYVLEPPAVPPSAVDRDGLRREAKRQRSILRLRRREGAGPLAMLGSVLGWLLASMWTFLPGRLIMHYLFHGGPLMAAGLSYNMLFASVAVLVIGFAVMGRWLGSDSEFRDLAVDAVDQTVPGLLNTGDGGLLPVSMLESTQPFTITWIIGAAVLGFTAWRWAAGLRLSSRRMFEVPPSRGAPAAAVPRDVLGLLVLVAVLTTSLVLNAEAAGALRLLEDQVGQVPLLSPLVRFMDGDVAFGAATAVGVGADALMLFLMYRVVAQLKPSAWAMTCMLILGASGNYLLREIGGVVIQAMTSSPYLLSIAITVGVLLWFYFFSQIILVSAAFGALVQADTHGGHPQPAGESRAVTAVAVSTLDEVRTRERRLI